MFNNELWQKPAGAAPSGDFYDYQIANSVRFMTGVGYFTRTPSSAGNRQIYTISFWIKRHFPTTSDFDVLCNAQESATTNYTDSIRFSSTGNLQIAFKGTLSGNLVTTRVFRDTSAWMHVVCAVDTTQGTASNRVKLYINGEQETDFSTATYPSQNYQGGWCNSREHALGRFTGASYTTIGNFYMANFALVDNSQLAPTSFGTSKNGVWIADDLSGLTWGTTGTWVRFESSSDLGNDSSGNNNDWTNNSVATHDQMKDTPTFNSSSNGGNFCTLNPIYPDITVARINDGNLAWGGSAGGGSVNEQGCMSTFAIPPSDTNKYYFEARMKSSPSGGVEQAIGVNVPTVDLTSDRGGRPTAWCISNNADQRIYNGANSYTTTGVSGSAGDIVGVEIDRANTTIKFYVNGTLRGTQTNLNTTTDLYPWVGTGGSTSDALGWDMNFGQNGSFNGLTTAQGESDATGYGNFYYDEAGSGKALCAGNLPTNALISPAESDDNFPQKLFGAKTYTGTGSTNAITGLGFQPDWVWIKERGGANNHMVFDSTRGASKYLSSNTSGDEGTDSATMNTFGSDGFTVGTDGKVNASSDTYVAWNWRANGGTTSSNTNGSITSTVQVDPSGSFSIVTYTGTESSATIGHGLSSAPQCVLVKCRDFDRNWAGLFVNGSGNTKSMILNSDANADTSSGYWNNTDPTSTVFSIGGGTETNKSGKLFVAYCFANCEGYIKSGTYVGNGNADGTFVYTGFKPAWVMVKNTSATEAWVVADNGRSPFNVVDEILKPNNSNAEATGSTYYCDFLSNGFKPRTTWEGWNQTNTFVYLAFAENPFQFATAR